mgnify:FL=1|jgi:hypothetical protein
MITKFEEFHIPEKLKERTITKVNIFERLVSHICQQTRVDNSSDCVNEIENFGIRR